MAFSTRKSSSPVFRSGSPSGRFHNSSSYTSFASASSAFSTRSAPFLQNKPAPSAPANLYRTSPSSSVRFSLDSRPISPSRSISSPTGNQNQAVKKLDSPKRTCMCSPTSHPGSFRCSLHKNSGNNNLNSTTTSYHPSNRLNARRSAMTNSLVRIGTVEGGDLVKRALAALIRPSSHQQRRRTSFQRRPSRLSVMSAAKDV